MNLSKQTSLINQSVLGKDENCIKSIKKSFVFKYSRSVSNVDKLHRLKYTIFTLINY